MSVVPSSLMDKSQICTKGHFCKKKLLHGVNFARGVTYAQRHFYTG